MKNEALAKLFYREIEKIASNEQLDEAGKVEALYRLLNLLFIELTRPEKIHFSTLFARIAYTCHKFQLHRQVQYFIHAFRKRALAVLQGREVGAVDLALGLKVLTELILAVFKVIPGSELAKVVPIDWPYEFRPVKIQAFKAKARVVVLDDEPEKNQLVARDAAYPDVSIRIQYGIPDRNDNFDPTINVVREVFGFPVVLNLIDVEIDEDHIYRPRAFVVEPDFLQDVSAIAECFKDYGVEPVQYLLKKYLPFTPNKYLLIGHIANFFLDELMSDPDASFKALFPKVFQLNPLSFCLFSDREIREIMQTSQKHFVNLKKMAKQEFQRQGIEAEGSFLEPSFYSETYGLQGRLDVFYRDPEEGKKGAIVELKSGKAYKPNVYGISANHFVQTLLYDLMVKSAFGIGLTTTNYILYSSLDDKQLRFAPTVKAQQFEALQLRNQLVALERQLAGLGQADLLDQARVFFGKINPALYPHIKGFAHRDLALFAQVFGALRPIEKKYLAAFSGFIAREQRLAKTGVQGVDKINGLAALWLNTSEEKKANFELLSHLEITENRVKEVEPLLVFKRTTETSPLANFRKGDISVLYPFTGEEAAVLSNQIFKCTIVDIDPERVVVRLRSRQFNDQTFKDFDRWNLEHDLLDSGFVMMYRALFAFAQSSPAKRNLLLAERPPRPSEPLAIEVAPELTPEQQQILKKLLAAEEYFLLWGPPGTGKTSMMLRHIVQYLLENTEENLLLLAYTNRAVDEICESIERIGDAIRKNYLRISSRDATARRFQEQLLSTKISKIQSRKALKGIIDDHRIFVGTVASITNRPELMELKQFDRVIIDEASQILEPMLVGLLPRFKRFVLIGDHKQLPAVVVQDAEESNVQDAELHGIGLNNLRNALFERLYRRCVQNNWDWAYAQLSHQGRMHREIMDFPNQHFYHGTLKILPEHLSRHQQQVQPLGLSPMGVQVELVNLLCENRIMFLPTSSDDANPMQKTNRYEAEMIAELVMAFQMLYQVNGKEFNKESLGIITPYRAQIAQIQETLKNRKIDLNQLTIDTVERYQGGAREIILISLCTNSINQLTSLVSLSDEGVDRKLNVALTRAREQLVIVGNPALLRNDPIYNKLIRYCQSAS